LFKFIALIDEEGKVVRYEETQDRDAKSWPIAIVSDPLRDLIVEKLDEHMLVVQEYGNLN
jgi:hypothetical protein